MRTRRLTAQVHWPAGHEQLGPQEQVHPGAGGESCVSSGGRDCWQQEQGDIPIVKMVSI